MKTNWSDYEVYLKPIHLKGKTVTLTIVRAVEEDTHPKGGAVVKAPVLYFRELPFGLILSPTNRQTLAALYGDAVSECIGKPIAVQSVAVRVGNLQKTPIRILNQRPAAPRVEPAPGEIVEPASVTEQPSPVGNDLPLPVGEGRGEGRGEGGSELDKYFGPNPRTAQPELPGVEWPTTKAQFEAWLKERKINGQETRSALGTDAASWLKINAGKSYADVAKTIHTVLFPVAATLAK